MVCISDMIEKGPRSKDLESAQNAHAQAGAKFGEYGEGARAARTRPPNTHHTHAACGMYSASRDECGHECGCSRGPSVQTEQIEIRSQRSTDPLVQAAVASRRRCESEWRGGLWQWPVRVFYILGTNAAQPRGSGSLPGGDTRPRRWRARLSTPEHRTSPQTDRSTQPPP